MTVAYFRVRCEECGRWYDENTDVDWFKPTVTWHLCPKCRRKKTAELHGEKR